jgi:hypothetical protein
MRTVLLSATMLCACANDKPVMVGDLQLVMTLPTSPNRDIDMLFVIDNSPSTLDKQQSFIASFPNMIEQLAMLPEGLPNLHIGVVSSDMGTTGSLDPAPGPSIGSGQGSCTGHGDDGVLQHASPNVTGAFISDVEDTAGGRVTNYTGMLQDVFTQNASLGANGCGFEQPLASMRRALTNPANAGFIRPDANLAVVILTDEDDCSMTHSAMLGPDTTTLGPLQSFRCTRFGLTCTTGGATTDDMNMVSVKDGCASRTDSPYVEDIASFASFLSGAKPDPSMVMIAAIAGVPTPVEVELRDPPGGGAAIPALTHSCSYQASDGLEVADPAVRIAQLTGEFPTRGSFETVCQADLTLPLTNIGLQARRLVGDPCVPVALADRDPAPGIQPTCTVTEGTTDVPACDGNNLDYCWQLVVDDQACTSSPQHLRFQMLRGTPAPANRSIEVRCLVR